MNSLLRLLSIFMLLQCGFSANLLAAPRDAGKPDSGAVLKLQAMVKSLTGERDAAKAESVKLAAEIEQLKKANQENAAKLSAADAAKQQLDGELTAQKTSASRVQETLDKTHEKLLEVIEKHKEVTQSKNELNNELTALKGKQQATEQQLTLCTEHNVKLYESGKDLLGRYQNKGTLGSLLQDEPALQFNSVEMENIVQDYEDKLRSGVYKK
jgi:chromosome segregation ATPase